MLILWLGWSVCKSECMSRLALFIYIFGSNIQNFTKLCKNINIGYAVIFGFHTFHRKGQTKVAYKKMCYKTPFSNKLYFDIYLEELKQTLRVHLHRKCKCFIHLQRSRKSSNKYMYILVVYHSRGIILFLVKIKNT